MRDVSSEKTLRDLVDGKILKVSDGYRAKVEELGGGGPLFLRAGALADSGFDWSGLDSFSASESAFPSKVGEPCDVVITTKGNSIGRVGFVPNDAPRFVYSPHLSYWRVIDASCLSARYLYYWTQSVEFKRQLSNLAFGTDMAPYFSLRDQLVVTINIPPICVQEGIAEVLGALDDKVAANESVASHAAELAQLRYFDATKGVTTTKMSSVLVPILGGTPDRRRDDYWAGRNPWASARDVANANLGLLIDTEQQITDLAVDSTKAKPIPRGGVILTARGTVGAVARVSQPTSFNQSCYGFEPDVLPPGILYFAIAGAAAMTHELAHGSVFDTVTMKSFDFLEVPDPAQFDVSRAEAMVAPLLDLVESLVLESRTLAALRDTLLSALMSGKLRVRDAEKEVEAVV